MKANVKDIIGKRISAVTIKFRKNQDVTPAAMLIIYFDDDSFYEFYSSLGDIQTTGGLLVGGFRGFLNHGGPDFKTIISATRNPDDGEVTVYRDVW